MGPGKAKRAWFWFLAGVILAPATLHSGQEMPPLKVLTFNLYGIIGAEAASLRAAASAHKIAQLDPDIIALEEAWVYRDRSIFLDHLQKAGYEIKDWRYVRNLYGAGLLLVSKYPIIQFRFERYKVAGGTSDLEWLGGKGISYALLQTPWGPLDFFHTHAIARMTDVFDATGHYIPGDPLETDRLLQMHQINRYVRGQRLQNNRSLIMVGDFNVSPEMREYRFLLALTGFENAFDLLNPGQNPSTFSVKNVFVTQECSRIDHVFFKNFTGTQGFGLKPVTAKIEMTDLFTNPKDMTQINYSDHYGLLVEFEPIPFANAPKPSPPGITPLPAPCQSCPLEGYKEGTLTLSNQNLRAWQDLALRFYDRARRYDMKQRQNPLLVPFADILIASGPTEIAFEDEARTELEKLLNPPETRYARTGK
jgi:endonuclease/exonuclease/phosphatase family metal-dependent hydrolase